MLCLPLGSTVETKLLGNSRSNLEPLITILKICFLIETNLLFLIQSQSRKWNAQRQHKGSCRFIYGLIRVKRCQNLIRKLFSLKPSSQITPEVQVSEYPLHLVLYKPQKFSIFTVSAGTDCGMWHCHFKSVLTCNCWWLSVNSSDTHAKYLGLPYFISGVYFPGVSLGGYPKWLTPCEEKVIKAEQTQKALNTLNHILDPTVEFNTGYTGNKTEVESCKQEIF